MTTSKYIPVQDAPFTPEDLVELQARLEDTEGHGIGSKAAARLLASLQHVERMLLAMVGAWAWECSGDLEEAKALIGVDEEGFTRDPQEHVDAARAYLAERGLLPAVPR